MFTCYNLSHVFWGVNREPWREREKKEGSEGRKKGRMGGIDEGRRDKES